MKKKKIILIISIIALTIFFIITIWTKEPPNKDNSNSATSPVVSTKPLFKQSPEPVSSPADTLSTPQSTPAGAMTSENYKTEMIKDFNITVNMPEQWLKKPQYDNRYEGNSGFVELTAMSGYGLSLKEAADTQINSESKPLGDNPQINNTTVDSQEAVIIVPSGNTDSKAQCAIVVKFPNPVTISGTPYYYLLVWADRAHLQNFSNGIKFVK